MNDFMVLTFKGDGQEIYLRPKQVEAIVSMADGSCLEYSMGDGSTVSKVRVAETVDVILAKISEASKSV